MASVKSKWERTGQGAIDWIEDYCRVPDGKHIGDKLRLPPFMQDDLRAIYDNEHRTRRAILSRGRKNAKTTQTALIVLLHLCGPMHVRNGQIFSAAQGLEQAGILFRLACKMIRMSRVLRATLDIKEARKEIHCPELGTVYRALSAETSTAYGLSPVLVIHDELAQVHGPRSELYEALETATAAQENPLSIIISTQARNDSDLLSILIDDAVEGHDPRTVLRLHVAPNDLDPFSDEAIRAANPAFDHFMNREEVRGMAKDAKRMAGRENDYRNLVLNQRVDASAPFVSVATWRACGSPVKPLDKCDAVFGGLDLSATKDLTALVLIGKIDGLWHIEPHFWLPSAGLAEKSRLDRTPYDLWHRQGFLETTPGATIDYDFVADRLTTLFRRYPIQKIAFDDWNFKFLKPYLLRAGMDERFIEAKFETFRQGFKSMSPALAELDRHLSNKRMAHGNHPVLQMCAYNSTVTTDPAENRKLVKKKYFGRIDGMIALTMAVGVVPSEVQATPEYQIMVL
jgi:phage terminase large subunit-like protein